jgi:nitroreductase
MKEFYIDNSKCIKDYKCTKVCALGLISVNKETKYPEFTKKANDLCMDCGQCAAVCNGCLTPKKTQMELEKSTSDLNIFKTDLQDLIKYRRSIRDYKNEQVSNEILTEIVDSVNYQPTACNQQKLEWVIINSKEKTKELAGLVVEWFRRCEQAPAIVEAWDNGNECVFRGASSVIICHAPTDSVLPEYDATIATAAIDLLLPTYDLGGCWAGLFMLASINNKISKDIYDYLEIPEGNRIFTGLMVGYPKFKYNHIPTRKSRKINIIQ